MEVGRCESDKQLVQPVCWIDLRVVYLQGERKKRGWVFSCKEGDRKSARTTMGASVQLEAPAGVDETRQVRGQGRP